MHLAKIWDLPHTHFYQIQQHELTIFQFFEKQTIKKFLSDDNIIDGVAAYIKRRNLTKFSSKKWEDMYEKHYSKKPQVC